MSNQNRKWDDGPISAGYSKNIRPKKTNYKGVWYDSGLEARVARAFDSLGIVFEHHMQQFLDDRFPYGKYTPDFHLPNPDVYIEVAWALDQRHRGNITTLCDILGSTKDDCRVVFIDTDGNSMWCWLDESKSLVTERGNVWSTTGNIFAAAEHPGSSHA